MAVQAATLVAGLALVNILDKPGYAQYSFAFAATSTAGMFVDLGFTRSIIALSGERAGDIAVVKNYVAAARFYRNRMYFVVGPLLCAAIIVTADRFGWTIWTTTLLIVAASASIHAQGVSACYSAPLIIEGAMGAYYGPQIAAACFRLVAVLSTGALEFLSGEVATVIMTISFVVTAAGVRRSAIRRGVKLETGRPRKESRDEMSQYLAPLWPGLVFTALQSQILIFLLAAVGGTHALADVSALARIGLLIGYLGPAISVFLEPLIARSPRAELTTRYFTVITITTVGGGLLTLAAWLEPQVFLLLIGDQYARLSNLVVLVTLTAALSMIAGTMWTMHASRKWVFWWHTWLYIVLISLVQIVCVMNLEVGTARGAVLMSLWTAVAVLVAHAVGGIAGFKHSRPRSSITNLDY